MGQLTILSIDAWKNEGWDWNTWHKIGMVESDILDKSVRHILKFMRDEGYLSNDSKGKVSVEDDQYNLVICERSNGRPLFAIEYGNTI